MESDFDLERDEFSLIGGPEAAQLVNRAAARHARRANIAFCDGHVEALLFKTLFLDRDDASLRRWNRDHEPHR